MKDIKKYVIIDILYNKFGRHFIIIIENKILHWWGK